MPCIKVDCPPMTRSEMLEALDRPLEAQKWRTYEALPEQRQRELNVYGIIERAKQGGGPMFFCGPGVRHDWVCAIDGCGGMSGFLCDWPMGSGKTCSAPLCDEHRRNIGHELDLCPVHATMWREEER